jgi:hypothetical protein
MGKRQKTSKKASSQPELNRVSLKIARMDANGERLERFVMIQKNPRIEFIDKKGRAYEKLEVKGETKISFEDNGRTLKIFAP